MDYNKDLFNAAVIAENSEMGFLVDEGRLHPVEQSIADLKKDQCKPEKVLPLMRSALNQLVKFANGKAPSHFTDMEKNISLKPNERDQIIEKILNIYTHLPHHCRNELSALIHHKQIAR